MTDKKRELTDEELKAAAGGSDRIEEGGDRIKAEPYTCDDDPNTDDCTHESHQPK